LHGSLLVCVHLLRACGAACLVVPPAPVGALRDEVGGLVALVLEPLDQGGDVVAQVGQLQGPLVGQGALDRGGDAEAAERDGGQGRDGDEQEQAGTDAAVLQGVGRASCRGRGEIWVGGGWLRKKERGERGCETCRW